ncbi:hypothetical protein C1H46_009681 [Malus baccata]|uniref:Exoribonuclease phosphorolytic domain-containing protein n=1 Tax=Malus baccata TaxID=106549 RepID=A0A540N0V3_MALBA|nr:hypothetical protein C1H46_009681 [Malus baccata]
MILCVVETSISKLFLFFNFFVHLRCFICGVQSCLGKNLVIDPVLEEESYQDGSLMLTCMPSRYEVTQLTITGEWSTPKLNEGMQICLDACAKLAEIMRACLKGTNSTLEES